MRAGREADALDPVQDRDASLAARDRDYLTKHGVKTLFEGLLAGLLTAKPKQPLQYAIDWLSLGPERAQQDAETGLPLHRQEALLQVFQAIDRDGSGRISLRLLQNYSNKFGGETLTLDDLRGLFQDFKPSNENFINQKEFLAFFARVSSSQSNADFAAMVEEMRS